MRMSLQCAVIFAAISRENVEKASRKNPIRGGQNLAGETDIGAGKEKGKADVDFPFF